MSDKQAERIEVDQQSHELIPIQRRSYIARITGTEQDGWKGVFFLWWNFFARWRKDEMSNPGEEMLDV